MPRGPIANPTWFWRRIRFDFDGIAAQAAVQDRMLLVVRIFYFYVAYTFLASTSSLVHILRNGFSPEFLVWPQRIVPSSCLLPLTLFAVVFGILSSVLAGMRLDRRWLRVSSLLCFVFFASSVYSAQRKIYHFHHTLMLTQLFFAFLPNASVPLAAQTAPRFARVFFGAQALVLMSYGSAGICKIIAAIYDLGRGEPTIFDVVALPLHLASQWHTAAHTLLGPWFMLHEGAAHAALWCVVALELLACFVAFVPAWHSAFGLALVAMHWAIANTMGIKFDVAQVVIILLLVFSPFAKLGEPKSRQSKKS